MLFAAQVLSGLMITDLRRSSPCVICRSFFSILIAVVLYLIASIIISTESAEKNRTNGVSYALI